LSFAARYFYLKKKEPLFAVSFKDLFIWNKEDGYLVRRIYSSFLTNIKK